MADTDTDISTLNHLIAAGIDSADGYEQAAVAVDDSELAETFRRFAASRRQIVAALSAEVVARGGKPEAGGTMLAGVQRAVDRIKAVFGSDRTVILGEVERGEDRIQEQYEAAFKAPLSAETRRAVEIAYGWVREGHDMVSAMQHCCTS